MNTHVNPRALKALIFPAIFSAMAFFTSCSKDTQSDQAITSDEAAEVMSKSVTPESDGIVADIESSSSVTTSDSSVWVVNRTFTRTGVFISQTGRRLTLTREAIIKAINVVVDRTTKKIISGTAELIVKGTNSAGRSFYYTGTLTFKGNGNGTLVLNSGQTFYLHW
jgi:hypothetical protein